MAVTTAPKRADARRNIEGIVAAATELLAINPDASISDIAARAGVGRVTLYGHFESRAALVAEVSRRAIISSEALLEEVDLDGDPRAAFGRLLDATWALTHRFGTLVVAAERELPPDAMRQAHEAPAERMRELLERGRARGVFRTDMPVEWQITVVHAVLHSAFAALHRGEITATKAPRLVSDTLIAAFTPSE